MKCLAVLFLGAMVYCMAQSLGGRPPNYSQDQMPITSFSCRDKILGGYYADPETQCQMFHVCVKVPGLGVQDYKFLCPNDTSFDQENQICDDWYNIDCEASTLFYSDNFDLYRIGSDLGGELVRDVPRLPNNNINNAVSDIDDDNYLQRGDRGENVGSDLLRGSHSGNFFSNKHRGREDEDIKDELNKKKKAAGNKNQVRKLLTGKRPILPSNQVAYHDNTQGTTAAAQQTRVNFASRNRVASNFQRNQQVTEVPQRQTEVYSNQRQNYNNNNQRNFYTPTTPKIETTSTQRSDYYKHNYYNPVTQQNSKFYDNTQNYNSQTSYSQTNKNFATQTTTKFPPNFQTAKNYQSFTPSSTQSPDTYNSQPAAPERINNYETQKLFKLNTAAFNQDQYDESKDDEFLKTAHSQNLGASNFNRVQNTLKQWNTSLTANYNFNQPTTTKTSVPFQQNYNPTTLRPSSQNFQYNGQQGNIYTQSTTQKPYQQSQSNFFTPSTTQKPQQQNNYVTASTSLKTFSQNVNTFFSPSTSQKPYQQTQNNFYTPSTTQKTTQQLNNVNTANPLNKVQNNFYSATTSPNVYQQRNFLTQTSSPNSFQQNNVQAQNPTPKPYQETHRQYNNYFTQKPDQPTTIKPRSRGGALYSHTTDATENPRPFTVPSTKITDSKDKEQYDYAYYDDGAQAPEYDVDTVDFARTKSKNKS